MKLQRKKSLYSRSFINDLLFHCVAPFAPNFLDIVKLILVSPPLFKIYETVAQNNDNCLVSEKSFPLKRVVLNVLLDKTMKLRMVTPHAFANEMIDNGGEFMKPYELINKIKNVMIRCCDHLEYTRPPIKGPDCAKDFHFGDCVSSVQWFHINKLDLNYCTDNLRAILSKSLISVPLLKHLTVQTKPNYIISSADFEFTIPSIQTLTLINFHYGAILTSSSGRKLFGEFVPNILLLELLFNNPICTYRKKKVSNRFYLPPNCTIQTNRNIFDLCALKNNSNRICFNGVQKLDQSEFEKQQSMKRKLLVVSSIDRSINSHNKKIKEVFPGIDLKRSFWKKNVIKSLATNNNISILQLSTIICQSLVEAKYQETIIRYIQIRSVEFYKVNNPENSIVNTQLASILGAIKTNNERYTKWILYWWIECKDKSKTSREELFLLLTSFYRDNDSFYSYICKYIEKVIGQTGSQYWKNVCLPQLLDQMNEAFCD